MSTILDNFIISLGFDTKGLQKGQKETAAEMQKMRDSTRKTGKEIEDAAKKSGEGIGKLTRNVVTLFATIAGSTALTTLVTGLTTANAELGRFGANVGIAPQRLAAWGAAVQRVGGDASQAQGSLGKLAGTLTQFRMGLTNLPDGFYQLMGRSGVQIDTTGSVEKYINGVAAAIQKLSAQGPKGRQEAFNLAQSLGIDNATFEVMRKYGAGLEDYLKTLEKVGPSNKAIDSAQKMQESWAKLVQTLTEVTQKLYEVAAPAITKLIDSLGNMVERLAKDVDWNAIGEGMNTFAQYAATASENVNGLAVATLALFSLWTGAKFTAALANMLLFRGGGAAGAAGAGAAAAGGLSMGGILKFLGIYGGAAAGAYSLTNPGEGLKNAPRRFGAWGVDDVIRKLLGTDGSTTPSPANNNQPDYNSLTRDPGAHGEKLAGDFKVDGRNVSKGNPLPVELASGGGGKSGGSWWSSLWEAIVPSANAAVPPSGGGGRGSGRDVDDSGIPNGASSGAVTGNAKRLMDRLVQKHGWTPAAAAISAGNANAESGFRTGIMGDPQVPGGSWGLYQWNRSRLAALKRFAADRGTDWKDFDTQVDFHAQEAEKMLPHWKGQTDLTHADMIGKRYEGYRGPIQRGRSAQAARYLSGYVPPAAGADSIANSAGGARVSALNTSNDNRRSSIMNSNSDTRIGSANFYIQSATDGASLADQTWNALMRRTGQLTTTAAANTGPM